MFDYGFMQHAFMAGTLIAILAGVVGYFIVLRNLAFASHALSHIGFAGATGAILLGTSPILGQLIITLLAAFGIGIAGNRINKGDLAIGIILAFSLGLGALFLHLNSNYAGQANIILFGTILGVSQQMLKLMFILTTVCLVVLAIISRPLLFASLEPELAEAKGLPLTRLTIMLLLIMAIAVTLASQAVGVLLVFTLLIGPAAIATQWTKTFWPGLWVSIITSLAIIWLGLSLSYVLDWPLSFWSSLLVLILYLLRPICCLLKLVNA
jgi:zinc/manganese transport system permease protein